VLYQVLAKDENPAPPKYEFQKTLQHNNVNDIILVTHVHLKINP